MDGMNGCDVGMSLGGRKAWSFATDLRGIQLSESAAVQL
jgi:hypothetical protein